MIKTLSRAVLVGLLACVLSGCFLTKIVTTPMRVVGASASMMGAVVSVVPVVGNRADKALETVDDVIDDAADTIDEVPI